MSFNVTSFNAEKVVDCDRYRPGYPPKLMSTFFRATDLPQNPVVLDIGAGTGALCGHFLENGAQVLALEPYDEMRKHLAGHFAGKSNFEILPSYAEDFDTGGREVDVIAAGRSLHWLDLERCEPCFQRASRDKTLRAVFGVRRRRDGTSFEVATQNVIEKFTVAANVCRVSHQEINKRFLAGKGDLLEVDFTKDFSIEEYSGFCRSLSVTSGEVSAMARLSEACNQLFIANEKDAHVQIGFTAWVEFAWCQKRTV